MEILAWLCREGWVTQLRTFAWVRVPAFIKSLVDNQDAERSLESSIELPPTRSRLGLPPNHPPPSPTSSTTSTHTAIPASSHLPLSSQSQYPETNMTNAILIPKPAQASGKTSRYLSAISMHVLKSQGVEAQKVWGKCVRYFDGKHAVEMIAVGEGWKRKRVEGLVAGWEEEGLVRRGRHW